MRLVLTWVGRTMVGAIIGAVIGLVIMITLIGIIMYATHTDHLTSLRYACVLALAMGGVIGGIHGGRHCIRAATRERIENIIQQYYPDDYRVTRRAGRSWFHWCCQRPMLKFIAGEMNNTERVCLHCGRYETYDIVRFDPFYGNDIWGWRLVS